MEGEVTQWDASSVLFTRNQHYGHVYRAHSLSCGWEGRSVPSTHPIFSPQNWTLIADVFMRGITKDLWNTAEKRVNGCPFYTYPPLCTWREDTRPSESDF